MKKNRILVAMLAFCSAAAAATPEKIRYDEIPSRLTPFGTVIAYRGIAVTTRDGKKYSGRRLLLEVDHVRVFPINPNEWKDIPAENVARIKITQTARYIHHIADNGSLGGAALLFCEGGPGCALALILVEPPFLVYAAASAPVYLAADVAFFRPARVFEIVQ